MSIPLDCLYTFIDNIAKEIDKNTLIYRFYPHGAKNIDNLEELAEDLDWQDRVLVYPIYCYDQEPLNYELYKNIIYADKDYFEICKSLGLYKDFNFTRFANIYNKKCLLHSEKRSKNLVRYESEQSCVGVYYWSHALIALDWFRYAQHVQPCKNVDKRFLVYNRAWSGTREYRLKFADLLLQLDLKDSCRTSVSAVEPELCIHYNQANFANPAWKPKSVLENFFPKSTAASSYSADFDLLDYQATDIEIVLETLFDDDRLHLTEKSLRPIALGQPFILAATHGSLEYLRSYGFKTFDHIWDESYDQCADPEKRLYKIADLAKQIAGWTPDEYARKMSQAQVIADYNKKHFFSAEFFDLVVNELKTNLHTGINQVISSGTDHFINWWNNLLTYDEITSYLKTKPNYRGFTFDKVQHALTVANSLTKKTII